MKRVHFIGSGFESVKSVYVDAETNGKAIDTAIQMYNENNWNFHYNEIEVEPYEYGKEGV